MGESEKINSLPRLPASGVGSPPPNPPPNPTPAASAVPSPPGKTDLNALEMKRLDIILHEHDCLRQEILTSIRLEHAGFGYGAILVAVVFGFATVLQLPQLSPYVADYKVVVVVVPLVFTGFIFNWLIEQGRINRAGNYLEMLEKRIYSLLGNQVGLSWETYLRLEGIKWPRAHNVQENAQFFPIGVFIVVDFAAIVEMVSLPRNLFANDVSYYFVVVIPSFAYLVVAFVALYYLRLVVRHKSESPKLKKKQGETEKGKEASFTMENEIAERLKGQTIVDPPQREP